MAGELTCQHHQNHIAKGTPKNVGHDINTPSWPPLTPLLCSSEPVSSAADQQSESGRLPAPLASAGHTSAFWQPVQHGLSPQQD